MAGKCSTHPHAQAREIQAAGKEMPWPAREWKSPSGAVRKLEDLLLAHLMVWLVSKKDFARKMSLEKSPMVRVF